MRVKVRARVRVRTLTLTLALTRTLTLTRGEEGRRVRGVDAEVGDGLHGALLHRLVLA